MVIGNAPSYRSLLLKMRFDGKSLATGTGFVIQAASGPHLFTARHNLTGRHPETGQPLSDTAAIPNEIAILHHRSGSPGEWLWRQEALEEGSAIRWREHPVLGDRADFAALPLTELDDVALYAYDLSSPGHDIRIEPAVAVSVVGFPFGRTAGGAFAIWATGFVASEPQVDFNDLPVMLIDCRTRGGQSGSPVVAYRPEGSVQFESGPAIVDGPVMRFLGLYTGRINAESDLGMVWKAPALRDLAASL